MLGGLGIPIDIRDGGMDAWAGVGIGKSSPGGGGSSSTTGRAWEGTGRMEPRSRLALPLLATSLKREGRS